MQKLTVRGFTGIQDDMSPEADPTKAWMLHDCYLERPDGTLSSAVMRPGWKRMTATTVATITGIGQGLAYTFTKLDGTSQLVTISGGKFYASANFSSAPVEVLTAANLSAASVTLAANVATYAVTFNNTMLISDGVNTPWTWDGTLNGGITKLTNTPVAYGPPTVYYARVFFIVASDHGTMQWCEVNSANTGYLAGGFNNQWTLGQTGSSPLVRLLGTNIGLFYWRASSIGLVRGAVTSSFSTDGTHDSISDTVGHANVGTPTLAAGYIWWSDGTIYGAPYRMPAGGGVPQPLWTSIARRFGPTIIMAPQDNPYNVGEANMQFSASFGWLSVPWLRQVICFTGTGISSTQLGIRFAADTGRVLGIDRWNQTYLAAVSLAPNTSVGVWGVLTNTDTVICQLDQMIGGTPFYGSDQYSSATSAPVTATIVGPQQGYDESTDWYFDEIDVAYEGNAVDSAASLKVDYLTDREHYSTLMAAQQSVTPYDATYQLKESRKPFGIAGSGSWIRVRVQMTSTGRLACKGWVVKAFATSTEAVVVP